MTPGPVSRSCFAAVVSSRVGSYRFLYATDYPHDDPGGLKKWEDRELFEANDRIPQADKDRIRWQNAHELFNLT